MDDYGKYGLVALKAVNKLNNMEEMVPCNAWDEAAKFVFRHS
jgi:hypothetical protein